MRVAAGALAELLLKKFCSNKLKVTSAVIQIGNEKINDKSCLLYTSDAADE